MEESMTTSVDIIIIGGGVAGLWTLHQCVAQGYHAVLLDHNALGTGQTINAQGIIHSGLKYAIHGKRTSATDALAAMPKRWEDCLEGNGDIDLSDATVLSEHQYLWSNKSLTSQLLTFFASKSLRSHLTSVSKEEYPDVLNHTSFKGRVYQLNEKVIDTPSLLSALAKPHQSRIFAFDTINIDAHKNQCAITHQDKTLTFTTQQFILTAGEGNEALQQALPITPIPMQRRRLHMVSVKRPETDTIYGHSINQGVNPVVTITTHPTKKGAVWYLGGQIAEVGIDKTPRQQQAIAKQLMTILLPWLDWSSCEWNSFFVDRAEPLQANGKKPDTFFTKAVLANVIVAWPTKMVLAPALADAIGSMLTCTPLTAPSPLPAWISPGIAQRTYI